MLRPLGRFVLIKPAKAESKTKGGLIIPDQAQKTPSRGTVLNIGEEVEEVAPGDSVVYRDFAGTKIKVEGKDLLVVDIDDVLLVFESKPDIFVNLTAKEIFEKLLNGDD